MRKNFKFKIAAVCGLLAILIGLTGCANNNSNKITVVGSSAVILLFKEEVRELVLAKYRQEQLKLELPMFLLKLKRE